MPLLTLQDPSFMPTNNNFNNKDTTVSKRIHRFFGAVYEMPTLVHAYAFLHSIFLLIFHIMINFLPHLLERHWEGKGVGSIEYVGLISSLPHLTTIMLAPIVGIIVDRYGHSLFICISAAITTTICFSLMLFTNCSILISVSGLAISQALNLSFFVYRIITSIIIIIIIITITTIRL